MKPSESYSTTAFLTYEQLHLPTALAEGYILHLTWVSTGSNRVAEADNLGHGNNAGFLMGG